LKTRQNSAGTAVEINGSELSLKQHFSDQLRCLASIQKPDCTDATLGSSFFRKLARNDFPNMPLLMGLEFLLERVFYNDIAPTALGSTSKLAP
jgi:hypothetical protein